MISSACHDGGKVVAGIKTLPYLCQHWQGSGNCWRGWPQATMAASYTRLRQAENLSFLVRETG